MKNLTKLLKKNPIIPAIKEEADIDITCKSKSNIIFVLYGDITNIESFVQKLKDANKTVFVNIDLIVGLSSNNISVDFLKKNTKVDGIISSKASLLRYAKQAGFITIHRFFIIDSFSYYSIEKQLVISNADMVNILPGWPMVISWLCKEIKQPIIAGGLVCDLKTVNDALDAGALSICSTNHFVWDILSTLELLE